MFFLDIQGRETRVRLSRNPKETPWSTPWSSRSRHSTGQATPQGKQKTDKMRDKFLYIMILVLIAIAFFEGGFIVGHLKTDGLKEKLQQVNAWVIDHGGRIVALETVQKKAEGRKQ
jgi:hypothetical protein